MKLLSKRDVIYVGKNNCVDPNYIWLILDAIRYG